VPTVLAALLAQDDWLTADLASLRMMAIGSTDVPVPLIEAVHDRGIPVVQVYGATETSPTAIYQTADIAFDTAGSIGRAGRACDILIAGPDGAEMPTGEVGEIRVRGDNILARYWNNEPASRASITDGWFHTGDMARVDDQGLYWFADRLKHVIISGGENIYPAELERVLRDVTGLAEFTVVGRDDERWGQVPVIVAVRADDTVTGESVLAHFDGQLARFKRPKDVVFVEALPRNALGKIVAEEVRALLRP
jgi:fatty-acyl-CoA synthase